MKKYVFYMMAAAIASGLTACSSNEDLAPESSTEQTTPSPYATIRASIGDEDATTRVAMNELSLSWSEGDAIGAVYSDDANNYKIIKYNYKGEGEFTVDEDQTSYLDNCTPVGVAFYPYNETVYYTSNGLMSKVINYYEEDADSNPDKISTPLLSTEYNETNNSYSFKMACGVFAVKVKNFKASMGYTKASLCDESASSSKSEHYGSWNSNAWTCMDGLGYTYSLANIKDGDFTLYFPLIAELYYHGLTFTLSNDDDTQKTGFKLKNLLKSVINTRYAKVIELNDDGTRKSDIVTLVNCELEVSDDVSADFSSMAESTTAKLVIPASTKYSPSVKFTFTGAPEIPVYRTVSFVQDESVETAKDLNLYFASSVSEFGPVLTINLPNSNVTIGGESKTEVTGGITIDAAKTLTVDKECTYSFCTLKVSHVEKVSLNNSFDRIEINEDVEEVTINQTIYGSLIVSGSDDTSNPRSLKLIINSGGSIKNLLYLKNNVSLTVENNTGGDITIPIQKDGSNSSISMSFAEGTTVLTSVTQ